ncbi:MAG: leucyl/phenylalanyl-tRNA--protein transferase [Rhodospirillaceae bacterium]|nr:leucyl/phenylalanyl-tRNA--protein transferase [Rhodospirillaceae bacterium]
MSRRDDALVMTPELMLRAYAAGIFPMAESRETDDVFWVDPKRRGILPLDNFHAGRRLRRTVRKGPYQVTCNTVFSKIVETCAEHTHKRQDTWINPPIEAAVNELHQMGFAHSVECWQDDALVGGLYGISLGAVFFGESMFSRATDASKVALVHLAARLKLGGFRLLDTQFVTDHLAQFGVIEVPARDYLVELENALKFQAVFPTHPSPEGWQDALGEVLKN